MRVLMRVPPKNIAERVSVLSAETHMRMPAPAFGVLKAVRHFSHGERHLVHDAQVGIHSLAHVEPGLLTLMCGQSFPLLCVNGSGVYEDCRANRLAKRVTQSVRHGVINS